MIQGYQRHAFENFDHRWNQSKGSCQKMDCLASCQ